MTPPNSPTILSTLRPHLHFTAQSNWINDPNGLFYNEGLYHLFFQHNPEGLEHGNMSWGHAISADLLTWEERPIAIRFDDREQIFSGSVVVDSTNSSGLGRNGISPVVAIYTSAYSNDIQAQSLAVSLDGGESWEKYAGNPVLDRGSSNFRDPKVFRYVGAAGAFWVLVAVEAEQRRVLFYRSENLTSWTYLSSYGPAGAVGGVWECPDLFPLALDDEPERQRWVLLISLNPGGVAGGSGTQYVVGDFDGTRFVPDTELPEVGAVEPALADLDWLDAGRDFYAGVTFNGLPLDERILIAWMSNWDYARALPTTPWRGAMALPRRLSLRTTDGRPQLRSEPVLPEGTLTASGNSFVLHGSVSIPALPVVCRIELTPSALASELTLEISDGTSAIQVTIDFDAGIVELDRTRAGSNVDSASFPSIETARLPSGAPASLDIVTDHDSIEIFAAGGLRTLTDLAYLGPGRSLSMASSRGIAIESFRITDLETG